MNNSPWTDAEIESLDLSWPEFHVLFPERSYDAYRHKRQALRDGHTPTPKKAPRSLPIANGVSDEEVFEALVAYQRVLQRAKPLPMEFDIQMETDEPIAVAFPSDWHIGNEWTDLVRIREDCRIIASHPRLFCALGGDPVDNFILDGMGSAARTQAAQVDIQWRVFRYLVKLLVENNSLLWVSSGNHDAWTHKVAGIDGVPNALHDIPVVYTGEGGLVRLKVGAQPYAIYRKHKPVRAKSGDNLTHFIKQTLMKFAPWDFDIGIAEHLHSPAIETFEWRPGSGIDRLAICCGSYKQRDQYGEGLAYYGTSYGVPTVIFRPDRREMLAFPSIRQAIDALDGVPHHGRYLHHAAGQPGRRQRRPA